MEAMIDYIAEQFSYSQDGELRYATDGLYPQSAFFKADDLYYFPKTSNWWLARALRESGLPITQVYAITAGNPYTPSTKIRESHTTEVAFLNLTRI